MGGRLWEGKLEGTIVTCPLHGSQFDLSDGHVIRWTNFPSIVIALMPVRKTSAAIALRISASRASPLPRAPLADRDGKGQKRDWAWSGTVRSRPLFDGGSLSHPTPRSPPLG
jgi:hypothetical protein